MLRIIIDDTTVLTEICLFVVIVGYSLFSSYCPEMGAIILRTTFRVQTPTVAFLGFFKSGGGAIYKKKTSNFLDAQKNVS